MVLVLLPKQKKVNTHKIQDVLPSPFEIMAMRLQYGKLGLVILIPPDPVKVQSGI